MLPYAENISFFKLAQGGARLAFLSDIISMAGIDLGKLVLVLARPQYNKEDYI